MPKIHYVDTGLACHLLGIRNEDVSLYHFRDNKQHEVDIVLERANGGVIGVEVKASASVSLRDFKGLSVLAEFAGNNFEQGILLYTGQAVLPFKLGEKTFYALPMGLFLGADSQKR